MWKPSGLQPQWLRWRTQVCSSSATLKIVRKNKSLQLCSNPKDCDKEDGSAALQQPKRLCGRHLVCRSLEQQSKHLYERQQICRNPKYGIDYDRSSASKQPQRLWWKGFVCSSENTYNMVMKTWDLQHYSNPKPVIKTAALQQPKRVCGRQQVCSSAATPKIV